MFFNFRDYVSIVIKGFRTLNTSVNNVSKVIENLGVIIVKAIMLFDSGLYIEFVIYKGIEFIMPRE